jgi:hypothetical protein
MNKNWRWQKITFGLAALESITFLCYTGKITEGTFTLHLATLIGMWVYQKKQEMEYKNQQNTGG